MRPPAYVLLLRLSFLSIIFGLVVMGVFARRGWLDLQRIQSQNYEMQQRIDSARRENELAERQIEALRHPSFQERMVRQVLGYVRPNETVIEFE